MIPRPALSSIDAQGIEYFVSLCAFYYTIANFVTGISRISPRRLCNTKFSDTEMAE